MNQGLQTICPPALRQTCGKPWVGHAAAPAATTFALASQALG
ncbi:MULTISPECIES: hypothetical protein [Rhizobium]|nr:MULTISPECIES: hypothetical protein [unclassified Rhizobium]